MTTYLRVSPEGAILELVRQLNLPEGFYDDLVEVSLPYDFDDTALENWTYINGVFEFHPPDLPEEVLSTYDLIKQLQDELAQVKGQLNL